VPLYFPPERFGSQLFGVLISAGRRKFAVLNPRRGPSDEPKTMTTKPAVPAAAPERRRHARAITSFSADLETGSERYLTRVVNLSLGGALLDFEGFPPAATIAVGDAVRVTIRCRGALRSATLDGKAVLWNLLTGKEPLLAIQFADVGGEAAEILEELLAEALAELGHRAARARMLGR
jgi:hypothetical protein